MDKNMCSTWFSSVFLPFIRTRHANQRVVLFWDNSPGHLNELARLHPQVKIISLPANLTAVHQPIDQGVIAAFKARYKTLLLQAYSEKIENVQSYLELQEKDKSAPRGNRGIKFAMKAHILDAIDLAFHAWQAVSLRTIVNCFISSDSLPHHTSTEIQRITGHALGPSAQQEAESTIQTNISLRKAYLSLIQTAQRAQQETSTVIQLLEDLHFDSSHLQTVDDTQIDQNLADWIMLEDSPQMRESMIEQYLESQESSSSLDEEDEINDSPLTNSAPPSTCSSIKQNDTQIIFYTKALIALCNTPEHQAAAERLKELLKGFEDRANARVKTQTSLQAFFKPKQ